MNEHIQVMKALADPTRLTLFKLTLDTELCVCELQELLQISQPAVSQHLARLKAVGLVKERRAGMWTYYRGNLGKVIADLQNMIHFLSADLASLDEMAELVARRGELSRVAMCETGRGEHES